MARVAVIEVGSRAVRLLVADASPSGLRASSNAVELHKLSAIGNRPAADLATALTHMGETIRDFHQRSQIAGADIVDVFGTEVLRGMDAATKAQLDRIAGVQITVLDPETEARASFAAGVIGLEQEVVTHDGQFNVVDQGGGSVEVAWGQRTPGAIEIAGFQTFKLGTNVLRSMVQAGGMVATLRDVRKAVEGSAIVPRPKAATLVLGSAITKVAWVDIRPHESAKYSPREVHGVRVSLRRIAELLKMSSANLPEFQQLIDPSNPTSGEPETIAAGLTGLAPIIKQLGATEVIASGWGTRYGYAWLRANETAPA